MRFVRVIVVCVVPDKLNEGMTVAEIDVLALNVNAETVRVVGKII